MIKKLRIKFVCVVMLIVTIMLGVILGGVMRFRNSENILLILASSTFVPEAVLWLSV